MGIGTGLLGATTGGFFKAAPLISKQHRSAVLCVFLLVNFANITFIKAQYCN